MYLEYNYRCPEPRRSIKELIDSFDPNSGLGFCIRNWHDGPYIDSCTIEEHFHSDFQFIKIRSWIGQQDLKCAKKKLSIKDLIKYCSDNGYDYKDKTERERKVIEVTLPNGSILIGNDGEYKYVTVAFIDFVIFAENETPEAFLSSMNDLLKHLSDAEEEYKSVMDKAQQLFTESSGLCEYVSKKIEERYGYSGVEMNEPNIEIKIPLKLNDYLLIDIKKHALNSENIDDVLNIVFGYEWLLKSDFCDSCNCLLYGDGIFNDMQDTTNLMRANFSKEYGLLASLHDDTFEEDAKGFIELYEKCRSLYIKLEEIAGEDGVGFKLRHEDPDENIDDECSIDEDEDDNIPYETGWSVDEDENGNLNFRIRGVDFKMIKVEAGTFMMGAAKNQMKDANKERELPVHQVTISNDFYIAEVPVTCVLFNRVMDNLYCFDEDQNSAYLRDLKNAQEFISCLNEITGKQFRLPTEAEWEFAARGGNKSKGYNFSGSNTIDEVAWYKGNYDYQSHPVKQKMPNELGIYDMSGNKWELCLDGYAEYAEGAQIDPVGNPGGELKVLRGGCEATSKKSCRTSHRFFVTPDGVMEDDPDRNYYALSTIRLVLSPFMPDDIPTSYE